MTDNVVKFERPPTENLIWVCNCGCTTHYHHSTGAMECGTCGAFMDPPDGAWRLRLPAEPETPAPLDDNNFKVIASDGAEMTLLRYSKAARREPVAAIVIVHGDGSTSTWGDRAAADDRKGWIAEAIDKARTRITGA